MKWALALLSLVIAFGTETTNAMWARMTDAELIRQSDLIVVGEWIGTAQIEISARQVKIHAGVIAVKEVLKGDPRQTAALVAVPGADQPISSSDIVYRRGQRGLWLLRLRSADEVGIYLADHPQRFLPEDKAAPQIENLRKLLKR